MARDTAGDGQRIHRWAELAIDENDVESFRRESNPKAYANITRTCVRYVRSVFGGGLTHEDAKDIVADALADELPSLRSPAVSVSELRIFVRRALERHRKRAKRHKLPFAQSEPALPDFTLEDITIARRHFVGVVETIEEHMQKSLRALSPRDRFLVVSAYGLAAALQSEPGSAGAEPTFPSPEARRKALWRAVQRFSATLEKSLVAALRSAKLHHRGVLEDALHIVRGGDVERAFAMARGL
jgi:DNA-directed RNA polymerase specialized sigma24 family protein